MALEWNPPPVDDISTSELVTAAYLNQLGNSLNFLERIAYVEFTADVSITATTVGTANQVVSAGAFTFLAVPHIILFRCSRLTSAASACNVILRDSTTVLGTISSEGASESSGAYFLSHSFTPTAASHTYNIAAWVGSGTWTFKASTGGAAGDATTTLPGSIQIWRIPT